MRFFSHLAMACLCRGREVKKSGGGGRNWGNDAAAGMDSANANADANDGEGGGWGANGASSAATTNEVCTPCFWWIKILDHFLSFVWLWYCLMQPEVTLAVVMVSYNRFR